MSADHALAERLRDADDNQVLSALTRLPPGPIPAGQAPMWARAYRRCGPEVRRSVASICLRRLSLQGRLAFFLHHPLFIRRGELHSWHGYRTYRANSEDFARDSRDLLRYREALSPLLRLSAELFAELQAAADVLWRSFRHSAAAELYRWIIALDPEHSRARFYLGQLQSAMGADDEALESFDAYLRLAPREQPPNAHILNPYFIDLHAYEPSAQEATTRIAAIYHRRGETDIARRALLRAIGRGPRHPMAPRFQLAQVLTELGDFNGAFARLLEAEESLSRPGFNDGDDDGPGDYRDLLAAMQRDYPMRSGLTATREKRLIEAFLAIAEGLRARGEPEQALGVYGHLGKLEKSRRGEESRPVLEGKLAIVAERYRDWPQVEQLSERILARWPRHSEARRYREQARRELGRG